MADTGKVDRGLSEAARKKYIKEQKQLEKRIDYIVNALTTGGPQDPSEVKKKKPKRKSLTPMVSKAYKKAASKAKRVSDAYKKAKKLDPSGRISDQDLSRGMVSKKAKRKRK